MTRKFAIWSTIFSALLFISGIRPVVSQTLINVNPDPLGEPWYVGGTRALTSDEEARVQADIPSLNSLRWRVPAKTLQPEINNSLLPFFPPIFTQLGGSCAQASGIGYVFTYEMAVTRQLNAAFPENRYPSHFTYNFLNSGSGDNGSWYWEGWKIVRQMGCPTMADYGGLYPLGNSGWMDGTEKYLTAMGNRVGNYYSIDVSSEEGLLLLKGWLINHLNPLMTTGGIACFSAGAANMTVRHLPLGTPHSTDYIITDFSDPVDHAMTIVGFDDSIRFDYNGDGHFTNNMDINGDGAVNLSDWEIGGFIMANSWGSGWADQGKAFMMYRLCTDSNHISSSRVYVVEPLFEYTPTVTTQLMMNHPRRNALKIFAGASNDTSSTLPEETFDFSALRFRGGEFPMTGSQDSIGFALDLTELYDRMENYHPIRLFLNVTERDTGNVYEGFIRSWSIHNTFGNPPELNYPDSMVTLVNDGTTRLSMVIPGTGLYPPHDLTATLSGRDVSLTWEKPVSHPAEWTIAGYRVFRNDQEIMVLTDSTITQFQDENLPDGSFDYQVRCLYAGLSGTVVSQPSNPAGIQLLVQPIAGAGKSLFFNGESDYLIGDSVNIAHKSFTMEFWARKKPRGGDNMVIGHGQWGTKDRGMHFGLRDNKIYCGFYGDDISADTAILDTTWHHYATTFDATTRLQSLYADGTLLKTRTSDSTYYGTGPVYIGCVSEIERFYSGTLDEVRIWDTVRTAAEIREGMALQIDPGAPGLLGFWRFDEPEGVHCLDASPKANHCRQARPTQLRTESDLRTRHQIPSDTVLNLFAGYSPAGVALSYEPLIPPAFGTLSFDLPTQTLQYTPDPAWPGYDSLTYVAGDGLYSDTCRLYFNPDQFPQTNTIPRLTPGTAGFVLFPNPGSDVIQVKFKETDLAKRTWRLLDFAGRIVACGQTYSGETGFQIQAKKLFPGAYLVEIESGDRIDRERLVITR